MDSATSAQTVDRSHRPLEIVAAWHSCEHDWKWQEQRNPPRGRDGKFELRTLGDVPTIWAGEIAFCAYFRA
jgi:hypothetical protein